MFFLLSSAWRSSSSCCAASSPDPRRLALPLRGGGWAACRSGAASTWRGQRGGRRRCGGWPSRRATDVAFALAALALAGPRLPPPLRVLLMSVAIADDLGAVVLIGVLRRHAAGRRAAGRRGAGLLALLAALVALAAGAVPVLRRRLRAGLGLHPEVGARPRARRRRLRHPCRSARAGRARTACWSTSWTACTPMSPSGCCRCSPSPRPAFSLSASEPDRPGSRPSPLGVMAALVIGKPLGVFGAPASRHGAEAGATADRRGWVRDPRRRPAVRHRLHRQPLFAALASAGAGARLADAALAVLLGSLLAVALARRWSPRAQRRRTDGRKCGRYA